MTAMEKRKIAKPTGLTNKSLRALLRYADVKEKSSIKWWNEMKCQNIGRVANLCSEIGPV